MSQTVESEILAELERAELAAREQRLSAQDEADRILEEARRTAARISEGLDARIADELAAFRRDTLRQAELEAAAIERELAGSVEGRAPSDEAEAGPPGFDAAVDEIVAAVLGETGPEG
jgi:vacuolar-type H+-ATPase subunit H